MKRVIVLVTAALAGCQMNQPPQPADGGKGAAASKRPSTKLPPAEAGGRFFARGTDAGDVRELKLQKFAVDVSPGPATVRSHLSLEVACAGEGQSEALIRLPVPRGAAITDAFLWVNDKPMRGAFVERQRAAAVYTTITTRRRDPALIAWDGPGWIALSIFPLEKDRARRLELEWVEPAAIADGHVQYRVPIVAEGERIVGRAVIKVDGRRLPGDERNLIAIAPADARKVFTRRAPGDPFQQILVPDPNATGAPHFVLVVETSAAVTGSERRRQRAVLDGLLGELPRDAKVTMMSADWNASPIVEDAGADAWPDALATLDALPSAGALHLERALHEAAVRAHKTGAAAVLFVGYARDGFGGDALSGPLAELRDAHVRLSAIDIAPGDHPGVLAEAAADTGGMSVPAHALDESIAELIDTLRPHPAPPVIAARGDGEWHILRTVVGGAVWIGHALGAEIAAEAETAPADAGSALADDLASLWDRARLEWHDARAGEEIARVLTPVTSLLVLESDADYRRFGLDVPAPVDVTQAQHQRHKEYIYGLRGPRENADTPPARKLAEEQARNAGTLGLLKQTEGSHIASMFGRDTALGNDAQDVLGALAGNQIGESHGVGGLGLVGTGVAGGGTGEGGIGLGNLGTIGKASGEGGNGSGYGRGVGGLGGKRARAPDVIPGQASVRGNLDKEIIRRIIRRHLNEVKYCYEQELAHRPGLGGRIMVQFTIAASGEVIASMLQNSTVGDSRVESCTVQAVRRWEFPRPIGGGIVIVSYPFVLTPSGGGEEPAPRMAAPAPSSPRPLDDALAALARGKGADQIEKISSLLGLRRTSSAEALAWTIDRRTGGTETRLLVARLLELGKRHRDAVRVLSERAYADPDAISAEMRKLGASADAAEVMRLVKR